MTFKITLQGLAPALMQRLKAELAELPGYLGAYEGFVAGEALDSAEAPGDRDWVASQNGPIEVFFKNQDDAARAAEIVRPWVTEVPVPEAVPEQDWDSDWKKSFSGVSVGDWRIVPPWIKSDKAREIVIEPGAGFGTGTHETTQLCLEELSILELNKKNVLDFGSGSGILAIGAALMGATVDAVEVDGLAVDNAKHNAGLNGVSERIHHSRAIPKGKTYDVIVANILRPVLLQFADALLAALRPGGTLILSGLIADDVEVIQRRFCVGLGATTRSRGDWFALTLDAARAASLSDQRPVSRL